MRLRLEISELKKQIGKYETLLSQLKNSIKDGIVELNPIINEEGNIIDFTICFFNDAFKAYSENDISGFIGKRLLKTDNIFLKELWFKLLKEAIISNEKIELEKYIPFWKKYLNITLFYNQEENLLSCITKDITTERENRRKYQRLFHSNNDGIFLCNCKGEFLEGNKVFHQLVGHSHEELKGKVLHTLIPREWIVACKKPENREELNKLPNTYEVEYKRSDNKTLPVNIRISVTNQEENSRSELWGIIRDLSYQNKIKEELNNKEKFIREVNEITRLGVFTHDFILNEHKWSDELFSILKLDKNVFKPSLDQLLKRVHPDDQDIVNTAVKKLKSSKKTLELNYRMIAQGGDTIYGKAKWLPILNDNGELAVLEAAFYDNSEVIGKTKQIEEIQKKNQYLTENSFDGIVFYDQKGIVTNLNSTVVQKLGYTTGEIIGRNRLEFIHPNYQNKGKINFEKVLQTPGKSIEFEQELIGKDKSTIYVQTVLINLLHDPSIKAIVSHFKDISKQKQAEKELLENEAHLRSLMESAKGFSVFRMRFDDLDDLEAGKVIFASPSVKELLLIDDPEDINQWLKDRTEEYRNQTLQELSLQLKNTESLNKIIEKNNPETGQTKYLQLVSKAVQQNGYTYLNGILTDVTQQKQQEIATQTSEEKYRLLANNMNDVIFTLSRDNKFTYISPTTIPIKGYDSEKLIGQSFDHVFSHQSLKKIDILLSAKEKAIESGLFSDEINTVDITEFSSEGHAIHLEITLKNIFKPDNQFHFSQGIIRNVTKQKNAQYALENREKLFNSILEQSPYAVIMTDKDKQIYYANQNACKSFGYDIEDLQTMLMDELDLKFGKRSGRESEFFKTLPKNESVRYEAQIIHKDGKIIPVNYNIRVIELNQQEFLLLYIEDLSDKKHAENAILQRDELFYNMLESSPFLVFLCNEKGLISYTNQLANKALGYSNKELIGLNIFNFGFGSNTVDDPNKFFNDISIDKNIELETIQFRKDGTSFPVKMDISKFMLDEYTYFLIFAQNIEEKKTAEKEIRIKDRAFESIQNAIIITDPNLENNPIIYANDAFTRITQYSREEVIGKNIDLLYRQNDKQPQVRVLKNIMKSLQSVEVTLQSYRKDKTLFYSRITVSPVVDENQQLINYICIISDDTQRRQIRKDLKEREIKYRSLFEISADSLVIIDTETLNIIDVNDYACKAYGYTRNEFLKLKATDLSYYPEVTKKVISKGKDGIQRSVQQQVHIKKNGDSFPCDISASFTIINNRLIVQASIRDISERVSYIKAIEDFERRYSQAALISKSGVWEIEPEVDKLYFDENLERVFGYEKGEMTKDSEEWFKHVYPQDQEFVRSLMDDIITGKKNVIEYEHRIIKKHGDIGWIFVKCVKLPQEENKPIRVLGTSIDITEKKEIELKEKDQKQILESVLQSMVEGVIIIDNKGNFIIFNESAKKISGKGPTDKDLTQWSKEYGLYEADQKTLIPYDQVPLVRALAGVRTSHKEIFIKNDQRPEGIYCVLSSNPIYNSDGTIYGAVVVFSDVTKQKLNLERLKTTEGRYLQAAKLGKLATFEILPNSNEFLYDESFRNLLGHEFSSYKHSIYQWLRLIPSEDRPIIYDVIRKYRVGMSSESRIIHRIKRKDSSIRWVEIRSRKIGIHPDKLKIIGTIIDITEQKEAGDEIIKREELLNETGKLAKVGGWEIDLKTNVVKWSNQTYRIFDMKPSERVTTTRALTYIKPEYKKIAEESIEYAIQNQENIDFQAEIITEKNRQKWIQFIGKPVIINGVVDRIVGAIQDITNKKESEKELILSKERAEKSDRLKSAFLTTMSHELRTPLNAVIGFSEIMDDSLSKDEMLDFARQINNSGNHLLDLIEDIFEISLIESGEAKVKKTEFDLNEILDDQFRIMLNEKFKMNKHEIDLKLIKSSESEAFMVYTDNFRYKQILSNLLKNALKFTHGGYVEFGYYVKDNQLTTFVKDSGIGIAKDQHDIIYERFRQVEDTNTRKYGGTGLGLYICKKVIELLNGEIWLESDEGKGASFFFSIPLKDYHKMNHNDKELAPDHKILDLSVFRDKELLIVEDEESNYLLLERILSKTPININWVKNGQDAISFCYEEDVDIVLMDIQLPKVNGYDATKNIKEFKPALPIIAQTAYAMAGDKEKALKAGCDDYLSKPINRNELLRILHKYLS